MTQLLTILIVLSLTLAVIFTIWFVLAACVVSGNISEQERREGKE